MPAGEQEAHLSFCPHGPCRPCTDAASAQELSTNPGSPALPSSLGAYSVPEGVAADGVLGGEGSAAQHDEDEDKVGEDVVVDELVAAHADPTGKAAAWTQPQKGLGPQHTRATPR